jgi:beta-fructofuranosidase
VKTPDPHLPVVHLRPPRNWINDPNGLVFHEGHYHVFFQYNPFGSHHANMHWGHFRSRDLVRWERLPIALTPTPGGEDADGCFSGNAVSANGQLVAFYSANRDDRWYQPVASAVSEDGGLTLHKRPGLLIEQPPEGTTMYRDPYVWRHGGRWRMLIGAALGDGRGAALLYESADGENWTYCDPFLSGADQPVPGGTRTGTGWECPQYAYVGDRGLLIISAWDPETPLSTVVFPGTEDDGRFVAEQPLALDHGPDFYAPALLPAPGGGGSGRWLLWGWAWESREAEWVKESGWAGLLTVPRELTIAEDGTPHQRPAAELLALRGRQLLHDAGQAADGQPVELGQISRSSDITVRLGPFGSLPSGLRLVTSDDDSQYLDICVDPVAGHLVVDREHASRDPQACGGSYRMPCPSAEPGGIVELRIVVDHSVAEVFLGSGQALTLRFYPTGDDPWRLQARPPQAGRLSFAAEAWELRPLQYEDLDPQQQADAPPVLD